MIRMSIAVEQLQCGHSPKAVENLDREPCRRLPCSGFNAATARRPWRTCYAEFRTGDGR